MLTFPEFKANRCFCNQIFKITLNGTDRASMVPLAYAVSPYSRRGVAAIFKTFKLNMELVKSTSQLPVPEITSIAKAFAESGMFQDAKTAAQAFVKIQAGQEIGIPPFASMTGIHIIQGKPIIGAGIMASRVKGSGKYDYKIVEQTEKICSIDFYQGKENIGNSTFTIEDARKAETKNLAKYPRNMLFARAISNGVKWFCPDVFSGPVYTAEDFDQDSTVDASYEVIKEEVKELPLKTTAYNHEALGTPEKPLINNATFKLIVERIDKGEKEVYEKALASYTFTAEQKTMLDDHFNQIQQPA